MEWIELGEKPEISKPADDSIAEPPFPKLAADLEQDEGVAEEILNAVTRILDRDRIRRTVGGSMIAETKSRRVAPDITIFEISGRLSLGNSLIAVETSIRRLVEEGARKLVIDLASLNAIDSSGIGLLVTSSGHIEQNGGRMRIAGARGAVAKALGMVHVDRLAPLDADLETSCRHFAADTSV